MMSRVTAMMKEDNFLSLAGNMVIALFGIAGFSLLARSLSITEFGQWVLFVTTGAFIDMFRFGITSTAVVRYLSGADDSFRLQIIGSNAYINLITTIGICLLIVLANICFHTAIQHSGYRLFFQWYPLLAVCNLFWNNALLVLQADRAYGKMLLIKSINSAVFFVVLLFHFFFIKIKLEEIVWGLIVINAATSIVSVYAQWDGIFLIKKSNKATRTMLFQFGKYTTFTLVATNLLRSADMFIISLSGMGSEAVALYSIPMKLTELQQIPLRSFTATAFPKMSKASMQHDWKGVRNFFYTYTGAITYLFVLVSLSTFLFADVFVLLIAGKQYLVNNATTGESAVAIVRVFSLYGLLLPLDRMTGIGLDSINKPNINAQKVVWMLLANIIGDVIAVYVFHSLLLVAVASIFFTLVGIYTGIRFLNRELSINIKQVFVSANSFYLTQLKKTSF